MRRYPRSAAARPSSTGPCPGSTAAPRPTGLQPLGQREQPLQGVEVGPEPAVRMRHHRGAAAEHRVAGEQPRASAARAGTTASPRCGRASPPRAGRAPRPRRRRRPPVPRRRAARRVERAHRHAAGQLRRSAPRPRCGRGGRASAAPPDPGASSSRVRVTTAARCPRRAAPGRRPPTPCRPRPPDPGVGAVQRHRSGVGREQAGGAPRPAARPRARGAEGRPAHRAGPRVHPQDRRPGWSGSAERSTTSPSTSTSSGCTA